MPQVPSISPKSAPFLTAPLRRMPAGLPTGQLTPYSVSPVSLQADSQGLTAINRTLPLGQRVAIWTPGVPVKLLSVSLATSMSNVTTNATMGVWISRDTGLLQILGANSETYVEHIVAPGLAHSQRGGQDYADSVAPVININQSVSIYVSNSGTGFANNAWSVTASIRYIEVNLFQQA